MQPVGSCSHEMLFNSHLLFVNLNNKKQGNAFKHRMLHILERTKTETWNFINFFYSQTEEFIITK